MARLRGRRSPRATEQRRDVVGEARRLADVERRSSHANGRLAAEAIALAGLHGPPFPHQRLHGGALLGEGDPDVEARGAVGLDAARAQLAEEGIAALRVRPLGVEDSSLQTSFVVDDTALNVQ